MKKVLKSLHRHFFGVNRHVSPLIRSIYEKLGPTAHIGERVMRYGQFRRIARCLDAEAAPGVMETVLHLLDRLPRDTSILDYGCGQAKSGYYRALGFKVHACDILPIETVDFTLIDPGLGRLPYADRSFDVVIASEVIEHVESPLALIQELLRIAKHQVILTTPNPQNLYSRSLFKRTGFLHWFTPEDFAYHCSPVFLWQLELFAKRHGVAIGEVRGNHEIFGLKGASREYAESLIISLSK